LIGKLLGNRYEIISQLGGGGMAIVYKATDTLLHRLVTVKMLRPEYTSDEEFVSRFRKEAQAVAKLSHPNVVSVYDVGQEGETHYIVMEYVEGRNLKQIIKEKVKLPLTQAVEIARQICEGLQHAHENGIIHRDIKPHNILVTENGKVKVTDFGIAQMMSSVTVTSSETIVGSVHYFSPEQAKGGTMGAKSDIYSVGVVLYEMVTGKVPFEGETPIAVALKHIKDEPIPPSRLNRQVMPELERIILRAMEKDATMRYRTAGDMARDLRKVAVGESPDDTRFMEADEFATRVLNGPVIITKERRGNGEEPAYRKKRRRMRPMAKLLIITAILGMLAGAAYGLNMFLNVPEVVVPDVRNKHVEDAKKILDEKKLGYNIQLQNDPKVESNIVISQDPAPPRRVKQNTTVTLTVSMGPSLAIVPDVVKKELTAARIDLENANFEVTVAAEEYSDEVTAGAVIRQVPEGNTKAIAGSTVKLWVSKGVQPSPVTVPNLVGLSLEAARAELEKAKLNLSSDLTQEESTEYPSGYVVRQEPLPETRLEEWDEVKVVLSKGPGPVAKTAAVKIEIPNDGLTHRVKIVVQDVTGERTAYEDEHNPGEKFTRLVTYFNRGKIQVFIDNMDTPVEERLVS